MKTKKTKFKPVRVMVDWDGGLVPGTYVGDVTVYLVLHGDGSGLHISPTAEQKPSAKDIKKCKGKVVEFKNNPKIKLDNGKIVYGCQVWWYRVEKHAR